MLPWLWLLAAGIFEVVWVVLLKLTDGFSRLGPSVATIAVLALSFFCMSQALRSLPMGTVYAVWTGIGAVGGMVWGITMQGEPAGMLRVLCICLILAGVAGLKIAS